MWFEPPAPNYRTRGFHKTGFQEPEAVNGAEEPTLERNHKHVSRFVGVGVERGNQGNGFAYGSETEYKKHSRTNYRRPREIMDQRTSAEKVMLRRQQQEAEADIEAHLEHKVKQKIEATTEKRKDLEMLQSYKPWGRPAAGAPRITPSGSLDTRRQRVNFDENNKEKVAYNPFGRPGAGAPLKTGSGKVATSLKVDPDLRFQEQLKKEVDHSLRYKPDVRSREGSQRRQQRIRPNSEENRRYEEREKKLKYGRKLEEQRLQDLERKAKEKEIERAGPVSYPWGNNEIDRDESGKLKHRQWLLEKEHKDLDKYYAGVTLGMGRQGAGAPLRDQDGKIQARVSNRNVTADNKDEYDPWGKPGAGAPIKSDSGKVKAGIVGRYTGHMERKSAHKKCKVDKTDASRGAGIDTASWMRTGIIGDVPRRDSATGQIVGVTKSFSDITANRYDIRSRHQKEDSSNDNKTYFTELQHQAEERHKQLQKERERNKHLDQQHVQKMEATWDNSSTKPSPRAKRQTEPQEEETSLQRLKKQRQYCRELRKMIEDRDTERRRVKESNIHSEKEHIATFDQQWGRPGAGAPRLNQKGDVDTMPKNMASMLETHVYNGWNFRRT